ncbi:Endocuticle structural glycoprotein SgAbd-2 [Orchesella cincta]|uniref:Endocuticle structural glycoprotein SgAbd-2 n=1 Tax=Orchesella cincta TaxID=48709 RepID=A0A1D2N0G3_ORCCI|nr:Endocuticle structural glycoprotein SgAbd-2 [Orchesella cincta]
MKLLIVFAVCVAATSALPGDYGSSPSIIRRVVSPSYGAQKEPIVLKTSVPSYAALPEVIRQIKKTIPIVKFRLDSDNYGNYNHESVSGDGSIITEAGSLKDLGDEEGPVTVSRGSYSFIGDDGKTYKVDWVADENGFQATGDHLPTPPPIPAEILKGIEESKGWAASFGDSGDFSSNTVKISSDTPATVFKTKTRPSVIRVKSISSSY